MQAENNGKRRRYRAEVMLRSASDHGEENIFPGAGTKQRKTAADLTEYGGDFFQTEREKRISDRPFLLLKMEDPFSRVQPERKKKHLQPGKQHEDGRDERNGPIVAERHDDEQDADRDDDPHDYS